MQKSLYPAHSQSALEDKVIYRDYLALCQGQLKETDWTITDKIGRDRHDRRKRVVDNRKGQAALTQVRLLKPLGKNSLVSCRLQTGRTHQIRVHLAHHGHALIGDPLYSRVTAPASCSTPKTQPDPPADLGRNQRGSTVGEF